MAAGLKELLDGEVGWAVVLAIVVPYVLLTWFVPRKCERPHYDCPWNQSERARRRYWQLRVWTARLDVAIGLLLVTLGLGRAICDLLLNEVVWTWPLLLGEGALGAWVTLRSLQELDRTKEKSDK